jgi:hypothetical protein
MTRREKTRRMRRMLAGLFAAAAVLVPSAPAAIVLDEPLDRMPQATIFGHDDPADRAAAADASLSVSEQLALVRGDSSGSAQPGLIRPDGPDGNVSNVVLRRDANVAPTSYSTSAPQPGGGSEFDWTASGLGAGFAALLLLLGFAAFRVVSRHHGVAQA